jgi:hypothetical protein
MIYINVKRAVNSFKVTKTLFLLALIVIFSAVSAFAQDIITLKNGDDIEALIEKVGGEEIEDKTWNNQTGPVYVINKSEVFMIKYRNGSKEVFNTTAKPAQTQAEQTKQPHSPSLTPSTPLTPLTPSTNLQNEFHRIGDDDKAMLEFFRKNNFTGYYDRFNKACKRKRSGNSFLGWGLGTTGVGAILMVCGAAQTTKADDIDKAMNSAFLVYMGGSLMGTGGLMTIGGIINCSVGASQKKAIKNDFYREYFGVTGYTYQPKLNFGTTANGIGLTLNF